MDNGKTNRDRFVDLAQKRVTKTLRDIQLIGNLSNRSAYDYTQEDAQKIYRALRSEVEKMKERFERTGQNNGAGFRLTS